MSGAFGLRWESAVGRGCGAREIPRVVPAAFLASGRAALALTAVAFPETPGELLYLVLTSFSGAF